ncbi:MAG: hypothetical protein OEM91_06415 [Hyphomicrobiales bacterium]|nr:hypothetical protein [Hyphomicrobiales bacterium]
MKFAIAVLSALWGALVGMSVLLASASRPAFADGMVAAVVNSPIFANGTVRDIRSGINIYLQSEQVGGLDFLDPKILGHGIPPGGRLEVEMVSGFQRDPNIPLAQPSILLVAGTPQQALPGRTIGFTVSEGNNRNTFVITPSTPDGLDAASMTAPAPGAKKDPIPQRGIKVIHVGMTMAFVSRGPRGRVEVRIFDGNGKLVSRGAGEVHFLNAPQPQIFPTNIAPTANAITTGRGLLPARPWAGKPVPCRSAFYCLKETNAMATAASSAPASSQAGNWQA